MRERTFEVTAISTFLEYPDCWAVQLVPVYKSIDEKNDYVKSNIDYIDTKSEGARDNDPGYVTEDSKLPTNNKEQSDYEFPKMSNTNDYSGFDEEE